MYLEEDVVILKEIIIEESDEIIGFQTSYPDGTKFPNGFPDLFIESIEEYSGIRPKILGYGAEGGSIIKVSTFLENYDRIKKYIIENFDNIQDNIYPKVGWIDCFITWIYLLCAKEYKHNPKFRHFDIENAPVDTELVTAYKKHYLDNAGLEKKHHKMRVKIHTTNQPDSDTTAYVVSCDRLDLLEITLNSFLATRDYETKMVIVDDSAREGVFEELVSKYGHMADVVCFPENRGLWWSMDFMVSYCSTDYIFYLEEDWQLTSKGYLNRSKNILKNHRDIGIVDISGRTFEWEGINSYWKKLIDDEFYYKKIWKITPDHYAWYGWCGSPNLRRRDDLVLLGRVEIRYTEWAIDRKFKSLGFKAVYLKDSYVNHLGDNRSRMAEKRTKETCSPENLYPQELLNSRTYPTFDYYLIEKEYVEQQASINSNKKTLVTIALDINREKYDGRNFENHYLESLQKICKTPHDLIVFADKNYESKIREFRGNKNLKIIPFTLDVLRSYDIYGKVKEIVESHSWATRSEWMLNSIIRSPDYIFLTLLKPHLMVKCIDEGHVETQDIFWIDSGIFNSFNVPFAMDDYNLDIIKEGSFFITSFPYYSEKEIHGYDVESYKKLCGSVPQKVYRAAFFGGDKSCVKNIYKKYKQFLIDSLKIGAVGTEESILSAICDGDNDVSEFPMTCGDIKQFLNTILV